MAKKPLLKECIFSSGLAWLVIPRNWAHFQSWRVFVVLCSVPSLSSALLFKLLMPESPKFLMEVFEGQKKKKGVFIILCLMLDACAIDFLQAGREKEAAHVFHLMFKLNTYGKGQRKV